MNMPMNETTGCDSQTQSVRGVAGEISDQLDRLGNGVDTLVRVMLQAGLLPTPIESTSKESICEPPRDSSLSAVMRDASNALRVSNNRFDELLATLERELTC